MTSEYVNATGLQRKAFFPRAPGIDLDSEGGVERIGKQVQWEKKKVYHGFINPERKRA